MNSVNAMCAEYIRETITVEFRAVTLCVEVCESVSLLHIHSI